MFSQKQVAEFKEGFQVMDKDRDGVINKQDLRGICDDVGRMTNDQELEQMLNDAGGPLNFTTLVHMFGSRSSGETDEDEVIAAGFRAFESNPGVINADKFRSMLMAFGQKFTNKEVDEAFEQMEIDDSGNINSNEVIGMLTASAKKDEEEA
ncbi:UNVERIFIED_CONTAM: hypothetical protein GTU68_040965 [Idotea baltica]|nr:hypothetical protein [Idotea baltica]